VFVETFGARMWASEKASWTVRFGGCVVSYIVLEMNCMVPVLLLDEIGGANIGLSAPALLDRNN
jgi:hypothetical protein